MLLRNGFKIWSSGGRRLVSGIGGNISSSTIGLCSSLNVTQTRTFVSGGEGKPSVVPGLHLPRTKVTSELWKSRLQQIQNEALLDGAHSSSPSQLLTKTPSESRREILLPFAEDVILRDQYISPFGHIRIGRLLEDLDALAGITTFSHTDDADHRTRALSVVTASVDRIQFKKTLSADHNLRLIGTPTWVGRSSMEVRIDVEEEAKPGHFERIAVAYFTMAARDPVTNKATQINKLLPETEEEKRRFKQGELNKQRRLAAAEISLQKQPPSADERFIIHDLFMRSSQEKEGTETNFVKMSSTTLQSVIFCQSQERNLANKIFGGYLMRKGFEVAFTAARLYSKTNVPPLCTAMEEVTFHRPVDIGDILSLKSTVVYTDIQARTMQVEVVAEVLHPTGSSSLTNTFVFAFVLPPPPTGTKDTLKPVLPYSYEEAMRYIQGHRRHLRRLEDGECSFL